jgi:hypothetical protein
MTHRLPKSLQTQLFDPSLIYLPKEYESRSVRTATQTSDWIDNLLELNESDLTKNKKSNGVMNTSAIVEVMQRYDIVFKGKKEVQCC